MGTVIPYTSDMASWESAMRDRDPSNVTFSASTPRYQFPQLFAQPVSGAQQLSPGGMAYLGDAGQAYGTQTTSDLDYWMNFHSNPPVPGQPLTNPLLNVPSEGFQYWSGYNPSQYGSTELATYLGQLLGANPMSTSPVGPLSPPSQNLLNFGFGDPLNAGLIGSRYSQWPSWLADAMTRAELALGNPTAAAEWPGSNPSAAPVPDWLANALGSFTHPPGSVGSGAPAPSASPFPWSTYTPPTYTGAQLDLLARNPAYQFRNQMAENPYVPTTPALSYPGDTAAVAPPPPPTSLTGAEQGGGDIYQWLANLSNLMQPLEVMSMTGGGSTGGGPQMSPLLNYNAQGAGLSTADFLRQLAQTGGGSTGGGPFIDPLANFDAFAQAQGLRTPLETVANTGIPTNAMPAWQAMVDAQQRNINRNAADITERFNTLGGVQSSPFANALNDFYQQTTRDQNSLLAQMMLASMEGAAGRQATGAGQLAQLGPQAAGLEVSRLGQLAGLGQSSAEAQLQRMLQAAGGYAGLGPQAGGLELQRLLGAAGLGQESAEAQLQRQLAASQGIAPYAFGGPSQLAGYGFQGGQADLARALQAAMQASGGTDAAIQAMANAGILGAQGMFGASTGAAQGLWGAENQAAQQLFGAQSLLPQMWSPYEMGLRQLELGTGRDISQLYNQNLQTGQNLGLMQYNLAQNMIDRDYQEWMRTQPTYNPLMQYLFAGATGYPPTYQPQYQPSQLPGILQGAGGILGALPAFLKIFGIGG